MDEKIYDKLKELEREIWELKIALLKSGKIESAKKKP